MPPLDSCQQQHRALDPCAPGKAVWPFQLHPCERWTTVSLCALLFISLSAECSFIYMRHFFGLLHFPHGFTTVSIHSTHISSSDIMSQNFMPGCFTVAFISWGFRHGEHFPLMELLFLEIFFVASGFYIILHHYQRIMIECIFSKWN